MYMKKLVLSLLCMGGILALPSCRDCCDRACDPCEDTCDYDDCYDDCDGDSKEVWGYEDQGGYRKKVYKKESVTQAPRKKVMYKPVNPDIIQEAEAAGKTCKFLDERYGKENKKMYKESTGKMKMKKPQAVEAE